MKLLTKEIIKTLPPLYAQENVADPIVHVKFFCPWNNWTWYATEGNPETGEFFGWVRGLEEELGYFNLKELEQIKHPSGLGIERDRYFKPTPLSKIKSGEVHGRGSGQ